jgi:ankyrin repeat protein
MDTPFGPWLHVAASFGNLEVVKRLIAAGVEVNRRGGTFEGNALNHAASGGHTEVVRYLLDCGSELDVSEPERNPLFSAIYGGHMEVVKLLLDRGLDPHVTYHSPRRGGNMDALSFARERGRTPIANFLAQLK